MKININNIFNIRFGSIFFWSVIILKPINFYAQEQDSLQFSKNLELEEVSIIGQGSPAVYSQLARKVTIISREEISASPATTIQDLLEYATSVDIRQRNLHGVQADIQLRGGSFDQVMVLLNGINISDPQTGHFSLDLPVELSSVERIEILHGSGARIYGANAHKGVINIITRKKTNQISAGLSIGQNKLIHSNVSGGISAKNFYNNLSFSNNTSDGFVENTDYKLNHLYYQGGINLQPLDISWQAGVNRKAFGANDFYSPSFPEQYEETSTGFGSLGMNTKGKIKFSFTGYWRRHNDHFLLKRNEPSFYENYHLTDITGLKAAINFSSLLGKTSMGIEDRNEGILSTVLGKDLSPPVKVKDTDSTYFTKQYTRNTLSYFLEQNYSINGISVTGGFLLNWNNEFHNNFDIFPGIDFSYLIPNEKIKLFSSINKSLRLPTFTDMFYKDPANEGNAGLEPEELMALETGMEIFLKKFSANLTVFRDEGRNVIDWVWLTDRSIYKAMNIAEVTTRGIELACKYQHLKNSGGSFQLNNIGASYTFIDLEKATGLYESKYSLDYLKHKLCIFYTQDISKKVQVNWQVSYLSRNGSYIDFDPLTSTRFSTPFKPYWLVDTKLYYTGRFFKVFTEASNLFDTKYTDVGNLIQPGRWIIAGIEVNLSFDD